MYQEAGSLSTTVPVRLKSKPGPVAYRLAMAGLCLVFLATLAGFAARPADGSAFAVIVPPHQGEPALLSALGTADGVLVRQSRYPWLAIVAPRTDQPAEAFRAALAKAGVILTLHPALLAGCFEDVNYSNTFRIHS